MNKLYEMNYAGCHMVVDSLEVLGDISGKGMKNVKKSVNELQAQQRAFSMKQNEYWASLASDGIITPFEKKTLFKEFKEIQQTQSTLENEAVKQHLESIEAWQDYVRAYNELKTYLYETLGLFNDMNSDTVIPDRTVFDQMYSTYYSSEKFTTLALATGIMGNLGFRVLESLNDPGTEGEIGLYRGTIYQYTSGSWLPVGLEGYMGVKTELPNAALNQYFMAGENFYVIDSLLINGDLLEVNNDILYINREFQEGFIYFYNGESWEKVKNTSDYRYVVAMVDLVSITGQLPGVFQEAIDRATVGLIDHIPSYLGPLNYFPTSGVNGDWFVYSGATIGSHIRSDIYEWQENDWRHIDPSDPTRSDQYMQALDDIMALNATGSETFAYIFANSFWAHNVTTDKLSTRTLYLRNGGYIQSDVTHYDPGRSGLRIDYNGNIDANGNTHIGGSCNIDGTGTIGAGMKILGDVDVTGQINTSKDVNITGNCNITGTGNIGAGMKILGKVDISGKIDTTESVHIGGACTIDGTTTVKTSTGAEVLKVDANGGTFSGALNAASGSFAGDISAASGTFRGNISTSGSIEAAGDMGISGRGTVSGLFVLGRLGRHEIQGLRVYNGDSLYIGTSTALSTLIHSYDSKAAIVNFFTGHAARLNEYSNLSSYVGTDGLYEIIKGYCTLRYGSNNAPISGELILAQYIWENGAIRRDGGFIMFRSGATVYKVFVADNTCILYQCNPSSSGSYTQNVTTTNLGSVNEISMTLG